MADQCRLFQAGPDPFGRMWQVQFRWLQTAISIRHADTVDVKFWVSTPGAEPEEKVIALPQSDLLQLTQNGRTLTDPLCMRLAALHLKHMIETSEDFDKTLVTLRPDQLAAHYQQLRRETVPQSR
ncbi:MAG TPA: hypothetical protein VHU83_18880 [Bryobacteraceae bacterium]|jgi:hypothetical protein|nr:hypothetical protein [Bryobacteraceae bacterium]